MKKITNLLLVAIALLFTQQTNAQQKVVNAYINNSFVVVNGHWYNASGNGNDPIPGSFGEFTENFKFAGEARSDAGQTVTMFYMIDGGTPVKVTLNPKNNDATKYFGETTIDISSLADGEHTIEVWFNTDGSAGSEWDSNKGNNFKSKFTKKGKLTGLDKITLKKRISVVNRVITVDGVEEFEVFSITGQKQDRKSTLKAGIYIVKVGNVAQKVIVK